MCLLGLAQSLKLWDPIGSRCPNSLFHSEFHTTETIVHPEVFHMDAGSQNWEEALLT